MHRGPPHEPCAYIKRQTFCRELQSIPPARLLSPDVSKLWMLKEAFSFKIDTKFSHSS